jgi:2-methylisocitrate lyase-like PEP mutase family enzyme
MAHGKVNLRERLTKPEALGVPGVHDGLSARMVAGAGFEVAFVSGAGVSMSRFGQADFGYIGLSDLADTVRAMSISAPNLALIVDIDTGFGNAINTAQTVRVLERAGANALQIEDQTLPKRCGHLAGKSVIPASEMVGKLRAACDARKSRDTLIIARTDALAVTGFEDALERGEMYLEAGADALFIEAPQNLEQMQHISKRFSGRIPLVHNLVEGGKSPVAGVDDLTELGYKIALFPLMFLNAGVPAQLRLLEHVRTAGNTAHFDEKLASLRDLNALLGVPELLELGAQFERGE